MIHRRVHLLFAVFVVHAFGVVLASADSPPPNIVVIVADDLGYADMSFLPQAPDDVSTPAIDRLAGMGTYFGNAYSTSPICSPSRAGLITGRYQQRWGNYWYGRGRICRTEEVTHGPRAGSRYTGILLPRRSARRTSTAGAAEHPLDHGFEDFSRLHASHLGLHPIERKADREPPETGSVRQDKGLGILNVGPLERDRGEPVSYEDGFTTRIFTDEAVKIIRQGKQSDAPFFIQLEHNAVHMPTYVADPDYARKAGFEQPAWNRDADRWPFPFWEPKEMDWGQWHKKWGHLEEVDPLGRKRYLAHLLALDDSVASILATLEETGQMNDTILVFLSDNGGTINTYSNNSPLRGYKYMFGEGGLRIPLIVAWPEQLPAGKSYDELVSAMDVFPTLLELVGEELPENLDGRSLVGKLRGEANGKGEAGTGHDFLCWSDGRGAEIVRRGKWKWVRSEGWTHSNYRLDEKGIAHSAPDATYPEGELLFDLSSDIGETTNLAAEHPKIARELSQLHLGWRAEMGEPRRAEKK